MAETYFGPEPYAALWNYLGGGRYDDSGDPLVSSSPQVQALIDQGLITRTQHQGQNETGTFNFTTDTFNSFDPRASQAVPKSTVPSTSFNWVPVVEGRKLIDPSLIYHDANYGTLTPSFNDKSNLGDWQDWIGPLVMGVVTLGAGALAGAGAAGAGLSAAEAGAGAGAAGAGWAGNTLASSPWYLSAGQSAAKYLGSTVLGGNEGYPVAASAASSSYGIPNNLLTPIQKSTPQMQPVQTYNPAAFGDMGSLGGMNSVGNPSAINDGSQRVATAVAPDAYGNSYNQVIT